MECEKIIVSIRRKMRPMSKDAFVVGVHLFSFFSFYSEEGWWIWAPATSRRIDSGDRIYSSWLSVIFFFLHISSMPSKTTKSSSVAKPRGKGSQDDSDDEMKEIKAHGEVHVDEPDAPQTNGKKQRVVCLFIYYEQNSLSPPQQGWSLRNGDRVSDFHWTDVSLLHSRWSI